jgi:peptidoglycan hydrolase CwlO-like protein
MSQQVAVDSLINVAINVLFGVLASYAIYVVTDIKGKIAEQRLDYTEKLENLRTGLTGSILSIQEDIEILHKRIDEDKKNIIELQRKIDVLEERLKTLKEEHLTNHKK